MKTNAYLSLFDMIGYLLVPFALDRMGRIKSHVVCFTVIGVCLLVSRYLLIYQAAATMTEWTAFILLNVGKVANAITFGGVFNFTAELFPTELRTSAVGIGILTVFIKLFNVF